MEMGRCYMHDMRGRCRRLSTSIMCQKHVRMFSRRGWKNPHRLTTLLKNTLNEYGGRFGQLRSGRLRRYGNMRIFTLVSRFGFRFVQQFPCFARVYFKKIIEFNELGFDLPLKMTRIHTGTCVHETCAEENKCTMCMPRFIITRNILESKYKIPRVIAELILEFARDPWPKWIHLSKEVCKCKLQLRELDGHSA